MVQIPVTNRNTVERQPLGNDRLRYTQARDFVGPAIEGFGQALSKGAKAWDEIEATYDEADALRISNEYDAYERERLRTGENAYLTQQGFDAGDSREPTVNDLRTGAENLLGGARSDRARKMAKRALDVKLGTSEELVANHAVRQMTVARNEQLGAQVSNAITSAVDSRGTDQFAVNLGLAQSVQAQLADFQGWSPERLADEQAKLVSNVHAQAVLAIDAEDGEPTAALEFLEASKDLLLPGEEAKLRNSLNPRVDAAWARGEIDGIVNGYIAGLPAPEEPAPEAQGVASDPLRGAGRTVAGGQFGAERPYGGHTGIDYAAAPGTPVRPTGGGVVTRAYRDPAYGYRVEIDHGGGVVTTYSHLDGLTVEAGQTVGADTVLGGVGNTGSASRGNHVHYETLRDGKKVDPATLPGQPGVPADPRLNSQNVQSAIESYIAANPGISERRAEALRAAGDQFVSNARADRAQAEQDADRRIMDWLNENKPGADDLTDMGQVPAAILAGASPSTVAAIQSRIQTTQSRIQARNDAAAAERAKQLETAAVFELYTLTDDELAQVDMRRYAGRVGLDKLGPWIDRQQRVANATGPKPVSSDRIASRIDSIGKPYGASRAPDAKEDERAAWIALREYVERRVAGRPDSEVSNEELRGIIAAGMSEVEIEGSGWLWNDVKPLATVPAGTRITTAIPPATKREIERNLEAAFLQRGRRNPPTEQEVWEAYQAGIARGLFE